MSSNSVFTLKTLKLKTGDDALEIIYVNGQQSSSSLANIKLVDGCLCFKSKYYVQCFYIFIIFMFLHPIFLGLAIELTLLINQHNMCFVQ